MKNVATTLKNWFRSYRLKLSKQFLDKEPDVVKTPGFFLSEAGEYFPGSTVTAPSSSNLMALVLILLTAGFVIIYSSSYIYASEKYADGLFFVKRQVFAAAMGAMVFAFTSRLAPKHWEKLIKFGFVISLLLVALTFVPGVASRAGGASRWISIMGLRFQPGEILKFFAIAFAATEIARRADREAVTSPFVSQFLGPFLYLLPALILLILQPDFGSCVLIILSVVIMIFVSGVSIKNLTQFTLGLLGMFTLVIASSPYRRARVLGYLDPWSDPSHKGFQIIQSLTAFFNGKWFGVGLGNSKEKLFYLPEAHNDFIFAVVGEEIGAVGVVAFIVLYGILILQGLRIARAQSDRLHRLLAVGFSACLGLQAFMNMAVVLALVPTKGLSLPLLSYGGTSLVVTLAVLGLLSNLAERVRS